MPEAIRILRDVADALGYAHRHGVVHRDIKPDNVLSRTTRPAARWSPTSAWPRRWAQDREIALTTTGVALGTPAYMSPEQAARIARHGSSRDIYALGVLGYAILTGRPPFTAPRRRRWSPRI